MKSTGQVADIHEVVMNTSFLNKSTLRVGNHLGHVRGQSSGHHFRDNLSNRMNQTYWSEVRDVLRSILFRDEGNVG